MRIITVRQPWAWAIIQGGKDVENRTRNIAGAYRGPVAIHAGVGPYVKDTPAGRLHREMYGGDVPTNLVFGGVIGVVELVGVHRSTDSECADHEHGINDAGEYLPCSIWAMDDHHHLVLANPRPLKSPIPATGRLGLWFPDDALLAAIREQVPS